MHPGEVGQEPAKSPLWRNISYAALFTILIWSAIAPVAKVALREFPLLSFISLRFLIAGLFIGLTMLVKRTNPVMEKGDRLRMAGAGLLAGCTQLIFIGGLSLTSASHTLILSATAPLVAAIGYAIVRRSMPHRSVSLGLVLGFLGVVFIVFTSGAGGDSSVAGDLLSLLSASLWVIVTILPRPLTKKYGPLVITFWMVVFGSLITFPISASGIPDVIANVPSLSAWIALVYTAVFGMFIASVLYNRAVHQIGPQKTLVYFYIQPVAGILLASFLLGERLAPVQIIGAALALAGVIIVQRRG